MNVAFVNENTLGHASYLGPFVNELEAHTELGIRPFLLDAAPLPDHLAFRGNFSIRGLRKWGLDFHNYRWRNATSRYVLEQLQWLTAKHPLDAVVANTQSVALSLAGWAPEVPLFICLDATFEQIVRSRWFAPNRGTRFFLPVTARAVLKRERQALERAHQLLAWSEVAARSLERDYGYTPKKIRLLPPSIDLNRWRPAHQTNSRPQILFMGGDFYRKGGPLLLDCFNRWFSATCDLHLVTQSPIETTSSIFVHHDVKAYSDTWYELWQSADVFVFPSTLDTFGIVLLEALAFEVPVISSDVGAARQILADGKAGWLLQDRSPETLAQALREALNNSVEARKRAAEGRKELALRYDLSQNTERLANWLHDASAGREHAGLVSTEASRH